MHRLFVAIRPPRSVRAHLIAAMGGRANARWRGDEQLHLTLRFIGAVEAPVADDIAAALRGVRSPPFEVAIEGVGRFDARSSGATIWAGLAPNATLNTLHKKVDRAIQTASLPPETRAFHPHITLARLSRSDATRINPASCPPCHRSASWSMPSHCTRVS